MHRSFSTLRFQFLVCASFLSVPHRLIAQSGGDWSYQIGARTTFMATTMELSSLGMGFRDLPPGGSRLAHSSSLFLLWPRGRHLRLGVENLVGNSYGNTDTGIQFQAIGITAEYQTTRLSFAVLGFQGGAMIASATQPGSEVGDPARAQAGTHYKGSGLFIAPYIGVGRRFGRRAVSIVAKQVMHLDQSSLLDSFDAAYVGLSLGLERRQ